MVEKIRRYARVADNLSPADRTETSRLCELLKSFSAQQAAEMVRQARGSPVLASYSCDGTPTRAKQRIQSQPAGDGVTRSGGDTAELLVQRTMFRWSHASGEVRTAVKLSEPSPMTQGKTLPPTFALCLRHWETLRAMGHRGICVHQYTFDRALHAGLVRLFRKKHA